MCCPVYWFGTQKSLSRAREELAARRATRAVLLIPASPNRVVDKFQRSIARRISELVSRFSGRTSDGPNKGHSGRVGVLRDCERGRPFGDVENAR